LKAALKILTYILLLFNGIGAIYGGSSLIFIPDGSGMNLSLQWLQATPFVNYLIPGLLLFTVNGLFSLSIFVLMLLGYPGYSWFVIAQGIVLIGWIVIQIIMMNTVVPLHLIMGATGFILTICGIANLSGSKPKPEKINSR
jgi:hypothetical protein